MSGKIVFKLAGLLMTGTLATYHTVVACHSLIKPTLESTSKLMDTGKETFMFDFTSPDAQVETWIESSDTVRQPGMSKATITLQKTQLFQRAIFFALLNPQPNGAGFAGVRHSTEFDLTNFTSINMKLRGQGQFTTFKIVLKHHGELGDASPSYEQFFKAPVNELDIVTLPLKEFKPFWRGKPVDDAAPLDTSNVTSFGIQYFGGVYEDSKQSGPATLEIDWVKASQ